MWPTVQGNSLDISRVQFGRISIANSDSEAYAYVDAAIDSAWRAVKKQTS
jgi:spermidine dehydrogenase